MSALAQSVSRTPPSVDTEGGVRGTEQQVLGRDPVRAAHRRAARRRALTSTLGAVVVLAVWQSATWLFQLPAWILPSPWRVAQEAVGSSGRLVDDTLATAGLTLEGFAIGVLSGLVIAVVLHNVPALRSAVYPLLVVSQNVPTIALAPLLVIWFGFGLLPKIIVITLVCFFPVAIAAMDGFRTADRASLDYLRMSGASPRQVFRLLEAPSALPAVFSGLKIAATYAVMGAIFAEWIGSDRGIGHYMLLQKSAFRVDRMFVAIAVIIVLSLALFGLVSLVESRVVTWRPSRDR